MKNLKGFTARLKGTGSSGKRVFWSSNDVLRLAKMYNVSEEEAADVCEKLATAPEPTGSAVEKASDKNDDELPLQWKWICSDGKRDRDGDIIDVSGIDLSAYDGNPSWFLQHNYSKQIGTSIDHTKEGGKLLSTLELAVDVLPEARPVQKQLSRGLVRTCSIGFDPVSWAPILNGGGGIHFKQVSLREISVVSMPANSGARLIGPVKSREEKAADYRKMSKAYRRMVAIENYMANTSPEQRQRERKAALLRIKARGYAG